MSIPNKVKWGVIGCGGIADRRTIPGIAIAENSTLEIVMDTNPQLCENVGKKYGVKYTTDIADVINSDVDAIYIATPVFCHKEQAIMAANAKKHILLEKPMGLTSAEAEEIIEVCNKNNVKIAVGLMMRYHEHHQEMKKLIKSKAIGDIVTMRAQFTCWYPDMPGVWRQDKARSGGGALMDLGIHCIDLLQYISGSNAKEVMAFCTTQTFNYNVDDTATVMMKMENGAQAFVDVNFNIPDDAAEGKIEFYGTKGSIIAYGTLTQEEVGITKITITQDGREYDPMQNRGELKTYQLPDSDGNMYKKEIECFADSILNDTPVHVSGKEALYVQKICECAYQSSEAGKKIIL